MNTSPYIDPMLTDKEFNELQNEAWKRGFDLQLYMSVKDQKEKISLIGKTGDMTPILRQLFKQKS